MLSEALRFVAEPGLFISVFFLCCPTHHPIAPSVLHGRAESPVALQLPCSRDSGPLCRNNGIEPAEHKLRLDACLHDSPYGTS